MKKLTSSRVFLLIWLILCVLVAISLVKHLVDVSRAAERLKQAEQRAEQMERENEEKKKLIEEAQSPFERERMIREELGMQKPGESVVEIVQNTQVATAAAVITDLEETPEQLPLSRFSAWIQTITSGIRGFFLRK
jgi:cell division protein FtsB